MNCFTRSMPRTARLTNIGDWAESQPEAHMAWTWDAVRGDPRGVCPDLCDCFLELIAASAHTALLSGQMIRRILHACIEDVASLADNAYLGCRN